MRGPVLAATSATLVTTLATAGELLRELAAEGFGESAIAGELLVALLSALRTGTGEFAVAAFEATCAAAGWPVAVEAWALTST